MSYSSSSYTSTSYTTVDTPTILGDPLVIGKLALQNSLIILGVNSRPMPIHFGETIRLVALGVSDINGNPVTSETIIVSIQNPNGSLEEFSTGIIMDEPGKFHYDYTVPADGPAGIYKQRWKITVAGRIAEAIDTFNVEPF